MPLSNDLVWPPVGSGGLTRTYGVPGDLVVAGRLVAGPDVRVSAAGVAASLSFVSDELGAPVVVGGRLPPLRSGVAATLRDLRPGELDAAAGGTAVRGAGGRTLVFASALDSVRLGEAARAARGGVVPYGDPARAARRDHGYDLVLRRRQARVEAAERAMLVLYRADRAAGEAPGQAFVHAVGEFARSHPRFDRVLLARSARLLARDLAAEPVDPSVRAFLAGGLAVAGAGRDPASWPGSRTAGLAMAGP